MKSIPFLLLYLASLATVSFAAEEADSSYVFWGLEVSALTKTGEAPILMASKNRLLVDTAKGVKKIGYNSNISYQPKASASHRLIEISDFKMKYDYLLQNQLEMQAESELMREQVNTDAQIGRLMVSRSDSAQQRIENLTQRQNELDTLVNSAIEDETYSSDSLTDLVHAEMMITSPFDVDDAYCVLSMQYQSPLSPAPISIGRVRYIGDLQAGIPNKVKVRVNIPQGYTYGFKYQFHLLTGESENLGTNISYGLKKVADEAADPSES